MHTRRGLWFALYAIPPPRSNSTTWCPAPREQAGDISMPLLKESKMILEKQAYFPWFERVLPPDDPEKTVHVGNYWRRPPRKRNSSKLVIDLMNRLRELHLRQTDKPSQ